MRYRKKNNILDFLGISILMSFYKKLKDFKKVFPRNMPYFQRNGIEIIILLDEPSEEKELLRFIGQYPFTNFKVLVNRKEHGWRNHSKVLNVGIQQASFDHILVIDPEVELITDIIYQLRYILFHYPQTFATGFVAFIDHQDDINRLEHCNWLSYGCIMAKKEDLLAIKGYDEDFEEWGGEDDHIRRRLELYGLKKIELVDAKVVHREDKSDNHQQRSQRIWSMPVKHLKHIFHPKKTVFNSENWGYDFSYIAWDWKTHKNHEQLERYLSQFENFHIKNTEICNQEYQIIALIQVRNESGNISEILPHLAPYCDGIVLLDDGSTDNSFEKAENNNILIKAQKGYKGYFDDLENRNILLRMASFFKAEWFFFIDADERFDLRFDNIREHACKKEADVYRFQLVDLWDHPEKYRVDLPGNRLNGIATRARMFRNKGNLQIHTNREIHFPVVPYSQNVRIAQLLLLHYGNYDKKTRERKYRLYISQDPDGKKQAHSYGFLRDKKVILRDTKEIGIHSSKSLNARISQNHE